jgi:high-affinity iron transporter
VAKMQEKWRVKLAKQVEDGSIASKGCWAAFGLWCEKYAMFVVPFVTVLREGLEGIVFITGVSFSVPATSVPLPVAVGMGAGIAVGFLIYK